MLNTYTVSFFGHRLINDFFTVEKELRKLIAHLLRTQTYIEFLVGRNGEFDQLVSSEIRRAKKEYRNDNCTHTLVLPYSTALLRNNYDSFKSYYDQIDIYDNLYKVHFKNAIKMRNKLMVDNSNLIIFYLEHEYGGAYQTYKYAVKQGKKTIILPNNNIY